jgi:hypothetical protein
MRPPDVVLVVFNRPDLARRTLERVLACETGRIWVVGDGPRAGRPEDEVEVAATRAAVRDHRDPRLVEDHSDENLGLRRNLERAIDRLIGEHGQGLVLEDDTLPEPSLFPFVAELLARYADDDRIGSICGQAMSRPAGSTASYGFSHIPSPWGWATWARAWRTYRRDLRGWPELRTSGQLERLVGPAAAREWGALFDHAATLDSYWIRWVLTGWCEHRLAAVPHTNLVSNIGIDHRSTHTTRSSRYARHGAQPTAPITFPLTHPPGLETRNADEEQRVVEAALPFSPGRRRLKQLILEGPRATARALRR